MLIKLCKSKENMCNFVAMNIKTKNIMKQICLTLTFLLGLCCGIMAQPSIKKIQLHLVPNHADALYKSGEQVKMKVVALHCGLMLNDVTVKYEVSEDMMSPHHS